MLKLLHRSDLQESPTLDGLLKLINSDDLESILKFFKQAQTEKEVETDTETDPLKKKLITDALKEQTYQDIGGVLNYLHQYVLNCGHETDFFDLRPSKTPTRYYSPLFALCQRSGSGKTKSLLELARMYLPLVYIGCSGNAKSPEVVVNAFLSLAMSKLDMPNDWAFRTLRLFYACAEYLFRFLIDRASSTGYLNTANLSEFVDLFVQPANMESEAWNYIRAIVDEYKTGFEEIIPAASEKNPFGKLKRLLSEEGVKWKFVIAFDEAKSLLRPPPSESTTFFSAFEVIRRVLRYYSKSMHHLLVVIVADTSSTITNCTPTPMHFHSSAARTEHSFGSNLYPPFFQLSGLDTGATVYVNKAKAAHEMWDTDAETGPWKTFLEERATKEKSQIEFALLGSPLWRVYVSVERGDFSMESLFIYAAQKMNSGGSENTASESSFIAALSCRVGLSILPDSVLAKDLVAGGMAQLNYLTRDRHYAFIGYPSDPTLAEGAKIIMRKWERQVLKTLLKHVAASLVDIGLSGEVVARILFIYALDRMNRINIKIENSELQSPWAPGKVSDFFQALLLEKQFNEMESNFSGLHIWNGLIFANHSIKLSEDMSHEHLAYAISRGAMVTGFLQQDAWDITIPVALPNGKMGMIMVQIKNWKRSISETVADIIFTGMHESNVLKNSVQIDTSKRPKRMVPAALETKQNHSKTVAVKDTEDDENALEVIYVLINFRQGDNRNTPRFYCNSSGNVFIQGGLSSIFRELFEESGALDDLSLLLLPRSARDHIRLSETTKLERELYDGQDHACTKCTLMP